MKSEKNDIISVIQKDSIKRNDYITEHKNFILSTASKVLNRYVSDHDDAYSVALIAFDEAITKYNPEKGSFTSFSALVIRNRLIDEFRKSEKNTLPFSSLSHENTDGEYEEFDIGDKNEVMSDAKIELSDLKAELLKFGFSLFEIPKDSPKSRKTKAAVSEVIRFMTQNSEAKDSLYKTKSLPSAMITSQTGAKAKILERHRKYIIAATLILNGDYPIISQYIKSISEMTTEQKNILFML